MKSNKLYYVILLSSAVLWFAASTTASEPSATTIRIKAGMFEPYTDSNGNLWKPDEGFEGGSTIDRDPSLAIEGTKDPALFLSEHYAMESFSCKIPNGKYIAKLYFAETYEGIYGPGERVFSFKLHGHEFKNFDIWEKAGGANRAYVETVPVEVTNGEFRIDFTFNIENPMINAIEIIPQAPADTATIRIKAGLFEPYKDSNGNLWKPDEGFEGGSTIDRDPSLAIEGTKDPVLFLSEHYAMESFSCKVPNGKYIAKLYFAETYEGIYGPGERVFSFKLHGHEFKDFDIWEKAGGANRAYIETVPVEVTNGEFRIDFTFNIENPMINAIEIIPQAAAGQSEPALKDVFKDYFLIGGALNGRVVTGRDPNAAAIAEKHFSTATPENDLKWQSVHPQPDQYNWEPGDNFVAFCEKNNIVPIGHTLVWHGQTPNWVFQGTSPTTSPNAAAEITDANAPRAGRRRGRGFGFRGPYATREELLQRMHDHINTVVGHYKGRIKGWDVVNEALDEDGSLRSRSLWLQIIGEGSEDKQYDFIENAFRWAHEADPDVELYYNDYNLDTSKAKCDGAVAIVKHLQSKGIRIDGVGIQLHGGLTYPSAENLEYAITTLAATGVKVMVTELDIRTQTRGYRGADISQVNRQSTEDQNAAAAETQKKLADKYAELFSIFLKHKKDITRVTFWGVYDATSWIGGSPLLFDRNYKPKEAFYAVIKTAQADK
jgi:endo-1,4-beta-xylanase